MRRLSQFLALMRRPTIWALLVCALGTARCANGGPANVSATPAGSLMASVTAPTASPSAIAPIGQIAFIGDDGNLWLLELSTRQRQPLTEGERAHAPAWSPDGTQLAYVRELPAQHEREIGLINISSRTRFSASGLRHSMLATVMWSPDARYLVGDVGCCATGRELVLLDSDGAQIQKRVGYSLRYAWSPDGAYLALARDEAVVPPIPVEAGQSSSLIILDLNQNTEQRLAQGTHEALYQPLCWLSAKTLLYEEQLWQTQQCKFWQVTIDQPSTPVEVITGVRPDCDRAALLQMLPPELQQGAGFASWSVDKQWVAVSVTKEGHASLYVVHLPSRTVHLVVTGREPAWRPMLSR